MEGLYNTFRLLLELTPTAFVRSFHNKINWKNRLIGLLGQKGVGKSTLLLQHIKLYNNLDSTLYVQADDIYFSTHTLFDTAYTFFKDGGNRLYIDEIHKYKGWSTEVKMIYDKLPTLFVIYSGSSLLDLQKGSKADLSRRAIEYVMPGLSFREYLNIRFGWNLKTSSFDEILSGKVDFPYAEHRPLPYFKDYCRIGYYPFFKEEDAIIRLRQVINAVVEEDVPKYAEMTVSSAAKLKKLMYILAQSAPFKPNMSKLAEDLDIGRNLLPDYIEYLQKAGIFNLLRDSSHSDSLLRKIDKLYLNNSNIAYAISETSPDVGTVRETIFLTMTKDNHTVCSSKISDFEIDGITFEIGGKSKTDRQIKDAEKGYIVKDDIEYAFKNIVPLWMFGFES